MEKLSDDGCIILTCVLVICAVCMALDSYGELGVLSLVGVLVSRLLLRCLASSSIVPSTVAAALQSGVQPPNQPLGQPGGVLDRATSVGSNTRVAQMRGAPRFGLTGLPEADMPASLS